MDEKLGRPGADQLCYPDSRPRQVEVGYHGIDRLKAVSRQDEQVYPPLEWLYFIMTAGLGCLITSRVSDGLMTGSRLIHVGIPRLWAFTSEANLSSGRLAYGPNSTLRKWLNRIGVETLVIEPGSDLTGGIVIRCRSFFIIVYGSNCEMRVFIVAFYEIIIDIVFERKCQG
jgi:hypothetical protein